MTDDRDPADQGGDQTPHEQYHQQTAEHFAAVQESMQALGDHIAAGPPPAAEAPQAKDDAPCDQTQERPRPLATGGKHMGTRHYTIPSPGARGRR